LRYGTVWKKAFFFFARLFDKTIIAFPTGIFREKLLLAIQRVKRTFFMSTNAEVISRT